MKTLIAQHVGALIVLALVATVLCAWLINRFSRRKMIFFANAGTTVTPGGLITRRADAAITTRYLLVKSGSDTDHIAVCGAGDLPMGVATDEADAAEDPVAVACFGSNIATQRMVASEAIAVNAYVYTAASGKIQNAPGNGAGEVYRVGRALREATADGHVIEVEPCFPMAVTF